MRATTLACGLLILGLSAISSFAESNWPQWRGPALNGSSPATNLPDTLDSSKNMKWQTHLPGVGSATPILFGDRIFVSCWDEQSKKMVGMCVSLKDGHSIWEKQIGLGYTENDRNNPASPSPVTNGKIVVFYYATGDLAAFDVDGKPLWARNIQKDHGNFNINWIYASSPLLYNGKLYIQVLQRDVPPHGPRRQGTGHADSYLLAIDPATGKDLWMHVRPNDAVEESKESYATPIPMEYQGRSEIILVGGDCVTAHDANTGEELWRAGGWNPQKIGHWRLVPSVVVDNALGLVYACAPKGGPVMAIKDGGHGDVTATGFAWKTTDFTSDVCVPLIYKNQLYVLDGDKKKLSCVDPASGKVKWSGSLGGRAVFRASPTGADNKIYCMNENGDVWVLSADEFKILNKTSFPGARQDRATIIVTDGTAILRVGDRLMAFGK